MRMQRRIAVALTVTMAALAGLAPNAIAVSTTRVSVNSSGVQGNNDSGGASISADGRFVAFGSTATNLVGGDTNGVADIFVRDRQTGQTTRVSKATNGTQSNGDSVHPSISADGRFVAFTSSATNLVTGDTNATLDVFLRDRQTGVTTRVSKATDGTQGNGGSERPEISADGRFVAFESLATLLVSGDTNSQRDVFVRDLQTGQTTRVSKSSNGAQPNGDSAAPDVSSDGRFVAFSSDASNLVAGDTNFVSDIFVRDRQTGQTTRVSKGSDGTQGDDTSILPAISADGRFVAFSSSSDNLVSGDTIGADDVFVRDLQTGQTTRVSKATNGTQGNNHSSVPSLSADGRFVAFYSYATNLVGGDTNGAQDIFVRDRQTGETTRVSKSTNGTQGNFSSFNPSVSADGRFVEFESDATNLVPGDSNGSEDIFVRDRQ